MTPDNSYQLYQIKRPKSTAEIRHADVQAGLYERSASRGWSPARPAHPAP